MTSQYSDIKPLDSLSIKKNYVIQFHSSALLLSMTSYSKLYTGEEVRLKFKATEPAKIG